MNQQAIKNFSAELFQEHLEEASFLYEQRIGLLNDPEVTWLDIEEFENRFEGHIDALVTGENSAIELCKEQANEGDFGELHAAVRVLCRQNKKDLVFEILDNLDPENVEAIQAVADALKCDIPKEWENDFVDKFSQGDQKLIPIFANVAGYRRWPVGKKLLESLQKNPQHPPIIIWALGRLREQDASRLLLNYLKDEDDSVCSAAGMALLRMGSQQVLKSCANEAQAKDWPLVLLGLSGNRSTISVLVKRASGEKPCPDAMVALGLMGDISAIDVLMSGLNNEETADKSAIALNIITGANLFEDAFIPEKLEEDELFEEELESFKAGKPPVQQNGEPMGAEVTRASQNPVEWKNWWKENKPRFAANIRYRSGKPYSQECLLETLESEFTPHIFRRFTNEELVIKYKPEFCFEVDMPVRQQKKCFNK
ncbi:MAG: HEAT repeat domain-containing protein [Nitrospinota bacterium]